MKGEKGVSKPETKQFFIANSKLLVIVFQNFRYSLVMETFNLHPVSKTEGKVDCASTLPDEILQKIFLELPLSDVVKLNLVCKRWYLVSRSNFIWQKFVPNYPGICLPEADTKYEVFRNLWLNSLQIGAERWFPNPLPDLVEHDAMVREEESKESGETVESKCVLYLRLNPVYPFTTDGVNTENSVIVKAVEVIYDQFGYIDLHEWESPDDMDEKLIYDAKSAMKISGFGSKSFFMDLIVNCLESENYLEFKKNRGRPQISEVARDEKCDQEGYRLKKTLLEDNFVDKSKNDNGKTRLDDNLFNQIRTILIGKNRNFAFYYLNDGCFGGTAYARRLLISDTAVVHIIEYYGEEY